MTYPNPVIKLTFSGQATADDIWSNGLTIGHNWTVAQATQVFNDLSLEDLQAIAVKFYVTTTDFLSMNGYNTLETIKMALVGTDGKYLADPKILDMGEIQGQGAWNVSPQDTVVVSFLTDVKRGLARRGRIFLPSGFIEPDALTGKLPAAIVSRIADKAVTFIREVNAWVRGVSPLGYVVVASNQREGAIRPVTGIEVGNVMDNQSRRRNRIREEYVKVQPIGV